MNATTQLATSNGDTHSQESVSSKPETTATIAQMTASFFGGASQPGMDSDHEGDPAAPGKPGTPVEDEAYLVSQICLIWNKSLDGVLDVGDLLNKLAQLVGKPKFKKKIVAQLPFTYSVAQRLRKLAKSARINDPKYRPLMPFSWNTLAAIDNLSDAAFQHGVEHGIIRPKCQFKDIKKLRDEFPEPEPAATGSSSASGSGAASATVAPPKGVRSKRLHDIKAKNAEREASDRNKPRPLFLSVFAATLEHHRPELAKLVEELNTRLPQEYFFISEVRLEERK